MTLRAMSIMLWFCGFLALVAVPAHGAERRVEILNMERPGSVWRYFERWETDICRQADGSLVHVDALDPRLYENHGGQWVSVKHDYFNGFAPGKIYRVKPTMTARGSLPPPADWMNAGFDDGRWARLTGPALFRYRSLAAIHLRGRFEVTDPQAAGDLRLVTAFRGGAVVYVNGTEVARSHLPPGAISPDTLDGDYPIEAYLKPDGNLIMQSCDGSPVQCHVWNASHLSGEPREAALKEIRRRYALRTRTLQAVIPAKWLRKGVNVIAIEARRSAAPPAMFTTDTRSYAYALEMQRLNHWWDRVAVEDVKLSAGAGAKGIVANTAPPTGMRAAAAAPVSGIDRFAYADANQLPGTIRLAGVRNGAYSAMVEVTAGTSMKGLIARAGELTGAAGTIAASAVEIGYGKWQPPAPGGRGQFDAIEPMAPAEVKATEKGAGVVIQPVWVIVRIGRDVAAGTYRGKLTITAEGQQPIEVPMEVRVIGNWVMPEPRQFATFVAFAQSPDALAMQYGVPMWSEEHWKLIDKSFELLGELGNREVVIPLVCQTHMGNADTMAYWVKQADGAYRADLTQVARYLDVAKKHLGKIPDVCLIVHAEDARQQRGQLFTVKDPAAGALTHRPLPKWGTREAIAFWKPVFEQMRGLLAQRGMEDSLTIYATQFSGWNKTLDAAVRELAPGAKLVTRTHVGSDLRGRRFYCAVMNGSGVYWDPDEDQPYYGWRQPLDTISFPRDAGSSKDWGPGIYVRTPVGFYRFFAEETLLNGHGGPQGRRADSRNFYLRHGFGQLGADFWPVLKDPTGRGNDKLLCVRYQDEASTGFQNSVPYIVAPGARGPAATGRFEMLREGLEAAEARVMIQNALLDHADRLGPELAARCKAACDEQTRFLRYLVEFHYDGALIPREIELRNEAMCGLAGEVDAALRR